MGQKSNDEGGDGYEEDASCWVLAVFVIWSVLDFVIHGMILGPTYMATPQLWRPMNQMKRGLLYFSSLVAAASFVYIYARLVTEKTIKSASLYGLIFGIGAGICMGYGSYSVMPIPYTAIDHSCADININISKLVDSIPDNLEIKDLKKQIEYELQSIAWVDEKA